MRRSPRGLFRSRKKDGKRGVALFMVMAAIALLTILMAELTYSTQINSRLSYNFLDNLKAFYLAKAALKLSELRLKGYLQLKTFLDSPDHKEIKAALPAGTIDKIWSLPLMFPIPVPKEAGLAATESINAFMKASSLPGTYTATIIGESSKLNLNMLFVKTAPPVGPSGASGASGNQSTPPIAGASGASGASGEAIEFRPALVEAIGSALDQKKNEDREFADVYRNVQGEDIVTAIEYYLFPDKQVSNLPGFKVFKPKLAPLYSLSELHLIPGIDDELYSLLEGLLTVYSTPGININTMNKKMLLSLIPEITLAEADDVLRKRDDPDVGQPWATADDFWTAVQATSAGKTLDTIKKRLSSAGIKLITDELSFKISIQANVGQSTRRLEAWLILDPDAAKQTQPGQPGLPGQNPQTQPPPQGVNMAGQPPVTGIPGTKDASGNAQATGLNLIYWRML